MEEKYVDENFEIQTRTKDETQIELEKVFLPLLANHGNKIQTLGYQPACFTETKSRKISKILFWERQRA